jgi:hypothetical protein
LFALLKQGGVNAELATEYAKDIVWEGRNYLPSDQIYIFAKQNRKLCRLYGKIDVIVTDSPLLLCYYYSGNEHILALLFEEMKRAQYLHVMLRRKKAYNPSGRTQTEDEAKKVDAEIAAVLGRLQIPFVEEIADQEVASRLFPIVKAELAREV